MNNAERSDRLHIRHQEQEEWLKVCTQFAKAVDDLNRATILHHQAHRKKQESEVRDVERAFARAFDQLAREEREMADRDQQFDYQLRSMLREREMDEKNRKKEEAEMAKKWHEEKVAELIEAKSFRTEKMQEKLQKHHDERLWRELEREKGNSVAKAKIFLGRSAFLPPDEVESSPLFDLDTANENNSKMMLLQQVDSVSSSTAKKQKQKSRFISTQEATSADNLLNQYRPNRSMSSTASSQQQLLLMYSSRSHEPPPYSSSPLRSSRPKNNNRRKGGKMMTAGMSSIGADYYDALYQDCCKKPTSPMTQQKNKADDDNNDVGEDYTIQLPIEARDNEDNEQMIPLHYPYAEKEDEDDETFGFSEHVHEPPGKRSWLQQKTNRTPHQHQRVQEEIEDQCSYSTPQPVKLASLPDGYPQNSASTPSPTSTTATALLKSKLLQRNQKQYNRQSRRDETVDKSLDDDDDDDDDDDETRQQEVVELVEQKNHHVKSAVSSNQKHHQQQVYHSNYSQEKDGDEDPLYTLSPIRKQPKRTIQQAGGGGRNLSPLKHSPLSHHVSLDGKKNGVYKSPSLSFSPSPQFSLLSPDQQKFDRDNQKNKMVGGGAGIYSPLNNSNSKKRSPLLQKAALSVDTTTTTTVHLQEQFDRDFRNFKRLQNVKTRREKSQMQKQRLEEEEKAREFIAEQKAMKQVELLTHEKKRLALSVDRMINPRKKTLSMPLNVVADRGRSIGESLLDSQLDRRQFIEKTIEHFTERVEELAREREQLRMERNAIDIEQKGEFDERSMKQKGSTSFWKADGAKLASPLRVSGSMKQLKSSSPRDGSTSPTQQQREEAAETSVIGGGSGGENASTRALISRALRGVNNPSPAMEELAKAVANPNQAIVDLSFIPVELQDLYYIRETFAKISHISTLNLSNQAFDAMETEILIDTLMNSINITEIVLKDTLFTPQSAGPELIQLAKKNYDIVKNQKALQIVRFKKSELAQVEKTEALRLPGVRKVAHEAFLCLCEWVCLADGALRCMYYLYEIEERDRYRVQFFEQKKRIQEELDYRNHWGIFFIEIESEEGKMREAITGLYDRQILLAKAQFNEIKRKILHDKRTLERRQEKDREAFEKGEREFRLEIRRYEREVRISLFNLFLEEKAVVDEIEAERQRKINEEKERLRKIEATKEAETEKKKMEEEKFRKRLEALLKRQEIERENCERTEATQRDRGVGAEERKSMMNILDFYKQLKINLKKWQAFCSRRKHRAHIGSQSLILDMRGWQKVKYYALKTMVPMPLLPYGHCDLNATSNYPNYMSERGMVHLEEYEIRNEDWIRQRTKFMGAHVSFTLLGRDIGSSTPPPPPSSSEGKNNEDHVVFEHDSLKFDNRFFMVSEEAPYEIYDLEEEYILGRVLVQTASHLELFVERHDTVGMKSLRRLMSSVGFFRGRDDIVKEVHGKIQITCYHLKPSETEGYCPGREPQKRCEVMAKRKKAAEDSKFPAWMATLKDVDPQTKEILVKEQVDEELFLELTEDDMKEIGITECNREAIWKELHKRKNIGKKKKEEEETVDENFERQVWNNFVGEEEKKNAADKKEEEGGKVSTPRRKQTPSKSRQGDAEDKERDQEKSELEKEDYPVIESTWSSPFHIHFENPILFLEDESKDLFSTFPVLEFHAGQGDSVLLPRDLRVRLPQLTRNFENAVIIVDIGPSVDDEDFITTSLTGQSKILTTSLELFAQGSKIGEVSTNNTLQTRIHQRKQFSPTKTCFKLNLSCRATHVESVLQGFSFRNYSETPSQTLRTFRISLEFPSLQFGATVEVRMKFVTYDEPTILRFPQDLQTMLYHLPIAFPTPLRSIVRQPICYFANQCDVRDVDTTKFSGGYLSMSILEEKPTELLKLSPKSQGVLQTQLGTVYYKESPVGKLQQRSPSWILIEFGDSASIDAVREIIHQVSYNNEELYSLTNFDETRVIETVLVVGKSPPVRSLGTLVATCPLIIVASNCLRVNYLQESGPQRLGVFHVRPNTNWTGGWIQIEVAAGLTDHDDLSLHEDEELRLMDTSDVGSIMSSKSGKSTVSAKSSALSRKNTTIPPSSGSQANLKKSASHASILSQSQQHLLEVSGVFIPTVDEVTSGTLILNGVQIGTVIACPRGIFIKLSPPSFSSPGGGNKLTSLKNSSGNEQAAKTTTTEVIAVPPVAPAVEVTSAHVETILKHVVFENVSSHPKELHKVVRVVSSVGPSPTDASIAAIHSSMASVEITVQTTKSSTELSRLTQEPKTFLSLSEEDRRGFCLFDDVSVYDFGTFIFNGAILTVDLVGGGDPKGDLLDILPPEEQKRRDRLQPVITIGFTNHELYCDNVQIGSVQFDMANPEGYSNVRVEFGEVLKVTEPVSSHEQAAQLNGAVTLTMIERVLRVITYTNIASKVKSGVRIYQAKVGFEGSEGRLKMNVNVQPPVLWNPDFGSDITYQEGSNPVAVFSKTVVNAGAEKDLIKEGALEIEILRQSFEETDIFQMDWKKAGGDFTYNKERGMVMVNGGKENGGKLFCEPHKISMQFDLSCKMSVKQLQALLRSIVFANKCKQALASYDRVIECRAIELNGLSELFSLSVNVFVRSTKKHPFLTFKKTNMEIVRQSPFVMLAPETELSIPTDILGEMSLLPPNTYITMEVKGGLESDWIGLEAARPEEVKELIENVLLQQQDGEASPRDMTTNRDSSHAATTTTVTDTGESQNEPSIKNALIMDSTHSSPERSRQPLHTEVGEVGAYLVRYSSSFIRLQVLKCRPVDLQSFLQQIGIALHRNRRRDRTAKKAIISEFHCGELQIARAQLILDIIPPLLEVPYTLRERGIVLRCGMTNQPHDVFCHLVIPSGHFADVANVDVELEALPFSQATSSWPISSVFSLKIGGQHGVQVKEPKGEIWFDSRLVGKVTSKTLSSSTSVSSAVADPSNALPVADKILVSVQLNKDRSKCLAPLLQRILRSFQCMILPATTEEAKSYFHGEGTGSSSEGESPVTPPIPPEEEGSPKPVPKQKATKTTSTHFKKSSVRSYLFRIKLQDVARNHLELEEVLPVSFQFY